MSNVEDIREACDTLRDLCDPRGHGVIDALEQLCIVESLSLDAVLNAAARIEPTNVIPLMRDWSVKVNGHGRA